MTDLDTGLSDLARKRQGHLARLLDHTFAAVEAEVRRRTKERGGFDVEQVYLPVVRNMSLEGSQITEIADRAGLSKQTVGPLVRDLSELGILQIDPHPDDGRAKLVRFTDRGLGGLAAGLEAVRSVERTCAQALGAGGLGRLKGDLRTVLDALSADDSEL